MPSSFTSSFASGRLCFSNGSPDFFSDGFVHGFWVWRTAGVYLLLNCASLLLSRILSYQWEISTF